MFSTELADVTGTHRWLDCARERGWGLKIGTCKVRNTDKVVKTSQGETIKTINTRCKDTIASNLEWVWLNWYDLLVEAEMCVCGCGCCCNGGTHDWQSHANCQIVTHFIIFINVIFCCTSAVGPGQSVGLDCPLLLRKMPPTFHNQMNQLSFVGSCVTCHSFLSLMASV